MCQRLRSLGPSCRDGKFTSGLAKFRLCKNGNVKTIFFQSLCETKAIVNTYCDIEFRVMMLEEARKLGQHKAKQCAAGHASACRMFEMSVKIEQKYHDAFDMIEHGSPLVCQTDAASLVREEPGPISVLSSRIRIEIDGCVRLSRSEAA
jgi:hypothetical protein